MPSKSRCTEICWFKLTMFVLALFFHLFLFFPLLNYTKQLQNFCRALKSFLIWNMQSEYWFLYFSNVPLYLVVCPLPSGWFLWKPHLNNISCCCLLFRSVDDHEFTTCACYKHPLLQMDIKYVNQFCSVHFSSWSGRSVFVPVINNQCFL